MYYSPKEALLQYLPSLTLNVLIKNDCYCIYKVLQFKEEEGLIWQKQKVYL